MTTANPLWGLPDPAAKPEFYADVPTKRAIAWVFDTLLIALITAIIVPFTAFTALFFLPVLYMTVGLAYRDAVAGGPVGDAGNAAGRHRVPHP